jgi:hypothetical protein
MQNIKFELFCTRLAPFISTYLSFSNERCNKIRVILQANDKSELSHLNEIRKGFNDSEENTLCFEATR